jgi:prepilin-type processing-associated H-X9-DG protein/prepilin-type N-terminal cleavage/methylation domain-containing protein
MPKKSQTGFTLVELLTVVAVTGVLAALLTTAVSKAKGRAQLIQCVNNVRQQGLGLTGFVADHHCYPLGFNPNHYQGAYPEHDTFWMSSLAKELGVKMRDTNNPPLGIASFYCGIFLCPAAVNRAVPIPGTGGWAVNIDYGYNSDGLIRIKPDGGSDLNSFGLGGHAVAFNKQNHGSTAPPIHPSDIVNPSEMLAIGDGFAGYKDVLLDTVPWLSRNRDFNGSETQRYLDYRQITKWVHARHQNRANMVFCDGHVESPTLEFLFQDTSDEALRVWNRDHLPHRELLLP